MEFGNGIPLETIGRSAKRLGADVFAQEHGRGFLLVHALDLSGSESDTGDTMSLRRKPDAEPAGGPAAVVFALVRKESSTFQFIAVGRNEKNDVSLPHGSVSRFHAYFKELGDGFVLQDAKSANGTRVGDQHAPKQGEGDPIPVANGDSVRFGDVITTFLTAAGLVAMAKSVIK